MWGCGVDRDRRPLAYAFPFKGGVQIILPQLLISQRWKLVEKSDRDHHYTFSLEFPKL